VTLAPPDGPRERTTPTRALFLRRALADQAHVGAVAPTSTTLAHRMSRLVPVRPGLRVVELGAGTGAVSSAVATRLAPASTHLALDRDPALLVALEQAVPSAIPVPGDATDLAEHLATHGLENVDVVLSTLPWSNFSDATQRRILEQVRAALVPSGFFATIAYRPTRARSSSRRFRRLLGASFTDVTVSATTWANLPPARLVVAREPRTSHLPYSGPVHPTAQ
jgi:phosphatidylethanolamine/phosphatidyl-N-methylethanolamine N-methyltransferase